MKTKIFTIITACFILGWMGSGLAMAGEGEYYSAQKELQATDNVQITPHNADKILGMKVTNKQGKSLGWIDDLIFSKDGRLSYLIVSDGGVQSSEAFKGEGGNLTAIPFDSVRNGLKVGSSLVTLPIDESKFSTAPSFTRNQLSKLQSGNWESEANAYFE